MSKINATRAGYFDGHKKVTELWFLSTGICYFTENAANNAVSGKKDITVDHVTRAEVGAWRAEQAAPVTPAPVLTPLQILQNANAAAQQAVTDAKKGLDTAQANLDQANNNKAAIQADAASTRIQKSDATKAVNKATSELADAKGIYENALVDATTAAESLSAAETAV